MRAYPHVRLFTRVCAITNYEQRAHDCTHVCTKDARAQVSTSVRIVGPKSGKTFLPDCQANQATPAVLCILLSNCRGEASPPVQVHDKMPCTACVHVVKLSVSLI